MSKKAYKHAQPCGLPREIIFQHLEKPPAAHEATVEFLEKNVWWWRALDYKRELWIEDQLDQWPNCELHRFLEARLPKNKLRLLNRQNTEVFMQANRAAFDNPDTRAVADHWWSCEEDAAVEYEWQARDLGRYPDGEPYICLSPAKRNKWKAKYYKLNLHHVPAVWQEGESTVLIEGGFLKDKWTQLFRFNLLQPDGYIWRELQNRLTTERRRLELPNPGPDEQNRQRRTRALSWSHIENVDIKTHSNQVTSSRTRQAESRNRRKS